MAIAEVSKISSNLNMELHASQIPTKTLEFDREQYEAIFVSEIWRFFRIASNVIFC